MGRIIVVIITHIESKSKQGLSQLVIKMKMFQIASEKNMSYLQYT